MYIKMSSFKTWGINFKVKIYFLLAGHKVDFIAQCGAKIVYFLTPLQKKNRVKHGKFFYLVAQYTIFY